VPVHQPYSQQPVERRRRPSLQHGADTDLDLLTYAIEANVDDTSFWLRKAIGWALRNSPKVEGLIRLPVSRSK
jgi:hypothetical protein